MICSEVSDQEYTDKQLINQIIHYQTELNLSQDEKTYALTMIGENSSLIQTYAKRIKTVYHILSQYSELYTQYQQNIQQLSNLLKITKAQDRLQISKLIYETRIQVQQILNNTNILRQQTKYPCDIYNFAVNEKSTYQQLYNGNIITAQDLPMIYQSIGLDFDMNEEQLASFLKKQLPKFRQLDLFLSQSQNNILTLLHTTITSIQQAFSSTYSQELQINTNINSFNFKKMLLAEQQLKQTYENQLQMNKLYNTTIMRVPVQIDHTNQNFECISITLKRIKLHHNVFSKSKTKEINMDFQNDINNEIDELDDEELRKQLVEQEKNLKVIDLDIDDYQNNKLINIITLSPSNSADLSTFNGSKLLASSLTENNLKELWNKLQTPYFEQQLLLNYFQNKQAISSSDTSIITNYVTKLKNILNCKQQIFNIQRQLIQKIEEFNNNQNKSLLFEQFKCVKTLSQQFCEQYKYFHELTSHYSSIDYQLNNIFNCFQNINLDNIIQMCEWLVSQDHLKQSKLQIDQLFQELQHKYNEKISIILLFLFTQFDPILDISQTNMNTLTMLINEFKQINIYQPLDNDIYDYITHRFIVLQQQYIQELIKNRHKYVCQVGVINEQLHVFESTNEIQQFQQYNTESLKILQQFIGTEQELEQSSQSDLISLSSKFNLSHDNDNIGNIQNKFFLSYKPFSDKTEIQDYDKILSDVIRQESQQNQINSIQLSQYTQQLQKKRQCCK